MASPTRRVDARLEKRVRREFFPADCDRAIGILRRWDTTACAPGEAPGRMQRAVLDRARGSVAGLRRAIAVARLDFRDVLIGPVRDRTVAPGPDEPAPGPDEAAFLRRSGRSRPTSPRGWPTPTGWPTAATRGPTTLGCSASGWPAAPRPTRRSSSGSEPCGRLGPGAGRPASAGCACGSRGSGAADRRHGGDGHDASGPAASTRSAPTAAAPQPGRHSRVLTRTYWAEGRVRASGSPGPSTTRCRSACTTRTPRSGSPAW